MRNRHGRFESNSAVQGVPVLLLEGHHACVLEQTGVKQEYGRLGLDKPAVEFGFTMLLS